VQYSYSLDDELVDAAFLEDLDDVRCLLAQGANPDARDEEQRTPLMLAVADGHGEMVRALLEGGADPNLRDQDGWSALDVAVARKMLEIAWLLVQFGAEVNASADLHRSPLSRALLLAGQPDPLVQVLVRWGAREDSAEPEPARYA
jgi:ankyrin repeat protein